MNETIMGMEIQTRILDKISSYQKLDSKELEEEITVHSKVDARVFCDDRCEITSR